MVDYSDVPVSILLVEDDPAQLRLFIHILRRAFGADMRLEGVSDPAEALRIIETGHVDILLTDLNLPGISGLDLLGRLKARNRCAQAILMTAYSTSDALLEALDAGAVDYLLKPVDQGLMLRLVRQAQQRIARWRDALANTFDRVRRNGDVRVASAL